MTNETNETSATYEVARDLGVVQFKMPKGMTWNGRGERGKGLYGISKNPQTGEQFHHFGFPIMNGFLNVFFYGMTARDVVEKRGRLTSFTAELVRKTCESGRVFMLLNLRATNKNTEKVLRIYRSNNGEDLPSSHKATLVEHIPFQESVGGALAIIKPIYKERKAAA